MGEEKLPHEDVKELAEAAMADKRDEVGDEGQARELWDVPTEEPGTLARQQEDDAAG
jgi:hypothetical protein